MKRLFIITIFFVYSTFMPHAIIARGIQGSLVEIQSNQPNPMINLERTEPQRLTLADILQEIIYDREFLGLVSPTSTVDGLELRSLSSFSDNDNDLVSDIDPGNLSRDI